MMNKNCCILIPVYNEELNIQKVISELRSVDKKSHIIVINDGSTDKTASIIRQLGVTLINSRKNQGSGKAMQKGFRHALVNKFPIVIQMDGDGQHDPKDISKIIKKMKAKKLDMVIGSRYIRKTSYKTPLHRFFCIKFLSIILHLFLNIKVTDPTSGYRAFNPKAVRFLMDHYKDGYPEVLSIAALATHGYKIGEVSVLMRPRHKGNSSLTVSKGVVCFLDNIRQIIKYSIIFSQSRNSPSPKRRSR